MDPDQPAASIGDTPIADILVENAVNGSEGLCDRIFGKIRFLSIA